MSAATITKYAHLIAAVPYQTESLALRLLDNSIIVI